MSGGVLDGIIGDAEGRERMISSKMERTLDIDPSKQMKEIWGIIQGLGPYSCIKVIIH